MPTPLEKIQKYKDRYVIFWEPGCPYSEDAMNFLKSHNLSYRDYIISKIPNNREKGTFMTLNELADYFNEDANKEATGYSEKHRTKPIIFFEGKFLGGFAELKGKVDGKVQ
jgi:glutaredoxin